MSVDRSTVNTTKVEAMSRWYTTVGVPGGEYARWAMGWDNAVRLVAESLGASMGIPVNTINISQIESALRSGADGVSVRPASPELAEWLDTATHTGSEPSMMLRRKVAGGWIAHCGINEEFYLYIPVAGAAGITVIGETE